MRIGELAGQTGASVRSLRYYEEQGLLTAQRHLGAQRHYPESAVERVELIRQLYAAGLASRTIAALLPCVEAPTASGTARSLAVLREQRDRIARQMAELGGTLSRLDAIIDAAVACDHDTPESVQSA